MAKKEFKAENSITDLEVYLSETNGFKRDLTAAQKATTDALRLALKIVSGIALISVCTNLALFPLKRVITEVLVLDRSMGMAQPLQTLKQVQVTLDEAFHRHFLNEFMLARESYTAGTAEENYYKAAAFMSPQLQDEWAKLFDPQNPKNPQNIYKNDRKVKIEILSISLKPTESTGKMDVATIRFRHRVISGSGSDLGTVWIATVNYQLVDTPVDEKQRRINPIGFQVIWYQTDPEVPGTPQKVAKPVVQPHAG